MEYHFESHSYDAAAFKRSVVAEELRIGNYLQTYMMFCDGISECREVPISIIKVSVKDIEIIQSLLHTYNPIPLTPEILAKCGFIDPSSNDMGLRMHFSKNEEICWYRQDGGLRHQTIGSGWTRLLDIKHLHQLQNFIFALYGRELTILL